MPPSGLKLATKLYYKKKYSRVIKLLEPKIYQYRSNFMYYYLLSNSCLFKKDYSGAFSYYQRALQLDENNINCMLGLAVVYLRRNNLDETLRLWLEIISIHPGCRQANTGLKLIKEGKSPEELFDNESDLKRLLPHDFKINFAAVSVFLISASVIVLSSYLIMSILNRSPREEIEDIIFPSTITYRMDENTDNIFTFNMDQVHEIFEKIRNYFNDYRENMALVEINRLLLSNAPLEIKDKAEMIRSYIKDPDFTSIRDIFSYEDIENEPYLYNGCYILWKGRVDDIQITEDKVYFNFLAGYHDNKELLGILPVYFDINLKDLDNIELLAQVTFFDNRLVLRGISYHKIIIES